MKGQPQQPPKQSEELKSRIEEDHSLMLKGALTPRFNKPEKLRSMADEEHSLLLKGALEPRFNKPK